MSRKDFIAGYMAGGKAVRMVDKRRNAGKFYDKLFDENDRIHESFYGDGADGRKYKIEIWESPEPGTWGQSNFNYSITDVDTGEWARYRDWYFMTMDALWERLDKDLDELGIRI